jgi:hypothetical protein
MQPVERRADHLGILEGVGVFFAAAGEPGDQVAHGGDVRRRIDLFVRLADPLAHPRKV